MADEKRVEEMAALLAGGDRMGQIRAALDLVRLNTPQAQQALISALSNTSDHSRACTAMAIGKLRLGGAVPMLVRMLKGNQFGFFRDRSAEVRQTVTFALGEIGGVAAIKALQMAHEKDTDEAVRTEATQALEKLNVLAHRG
ncbi:HEAT repeat domain-containing protein [Candidatus Cyanaurora vandensis]|uniref:HEAT repeat domain-containing protein n=1 Tax=Candidatus Cyanaurora vandensis TaxID=2714958 RepID=UPI002579F208|nr:HEAT repeat domain-containing protein [Candidatus Cyanaurora vandensis]